MFTIKLYGQQGYRQRILSAESFTILWDRDRSVTEISLHQRNANEDSRYDIGGEQKDDAQIIWDKAIIENAAGRTTEIIGGVPR